MSCNDKTSYTSKLECVAGGRVGSLSYVASERHKMLDELLAVIHRDGGHYTLEHGYKKSFADAVAKVAKCLQ